MSRLSDSTASVFQRRAYAFGSGCMGSLGEVRGSGRRGRRSRRSGGRRRAAAARAPPAVRGLHAPPDGVAAREAGGRHPVPAQRAVEAPPGRERRCAFAGGVPVVEQERRHGRSVAEPRTPDIRGGTLNPHPDRGYAGPTVALSHDHPVGREPELERLGQALDDLERGGNPCVAVEGEAGIGKTLAAVRAAAPGRGAGPSRPGGSGGGVRARPAVRRLGRRARRLRRLAGPRRGVGHRRAALDRAGVRRRAAPSPPRAARAAGGDRGAQAARAGPRRPALERRRLDRGARRAAAPRHDRARAAGARVPLGEGAREADRGARGRDDHRPRSAERDRVRPHWSAPGTMRRRSTRRAAATRSTRSSWPQAAELPSRSSSGDRLARDAGVPARGRGHDRRAARVAERGRPQPGRTRARSPATRSSPSSRTRSPNWRPTRASSRSTSCSTRACCSPPTCRGDSPSGTRSCAARSTRPPRAAGGSAGHARAAETLAAQGVAAAARAHHVEQSGVRGDRAAIDVLLEAGRRDRPDGAGRRRALVRGGAAVDARGRPAGPPARAGGSRPDAAVHRRSRALRDDAARGARARPRGRRRAPAPAHVGVCLVRELPRPPRRGRATTRRRPRGAAGPALARGGHRAVAARDRRLLHRRHRSDVRAGQTRAGRRPRPRRARAGRRPRPRCSRTAARRRG